MSDPNPYAAPGWVGASGASDQLTAPQYILTARTPDGRLVTERVEAASGDAAVETFRDQGFTDIVLHTDDVAALLRLPKGAQRFVSPRDFVEGRTRHGYLEDVTFGLRMVFAGRAWYCLLPWMPWIAVFAIRRFLGYPWGIWDYGLIGLSIFPLIFILVAPLFFFASRAYHRLTEDASWGRWQAVLDRLPQLRAHLPPDVYAFHQAEALAGLGRLDEAIALVRPPEDGGQMPLWLYWCRLAGLYFTGKEYDRGIACEENASQLAPDNPTVIISLAVSLLRYRRDAKRARRLLQEARTHTLSDLLVPVVEMAEGIAALEEGQPAEAQRLLEGSLPKFQPFLRSNPLISTWLAMIHAYLALAATALADHASARRHYGLAEPRLHALRSDDLLSRCQRAIPGGPLP